MKRLLLTLCLVIPSTVYALPIDGRYTFTGTLTVDESLQTMFPDLGGTYTGVLWFLSLGDGYPAQFASGTLTDGDYNLNVAGYPTSDIWTPYSSVMNGPMGSILNGPSFLTGIYYTSRFDFAQNLFTINFRFANGNEDTANGTMSPFTRTIVTPDKGSTFVLLLISLLALYKGYRTAHIVA